MLRWRESTNLVAKMIGLGARHDSPKDFRSSENMLFSVDHGDF